MIVIYGAIAGVSVGKLFLAVLRGFFFGIAATLGFDAVWFASLVIANLQISFLTPSFAHSIFYLKGIVPPEVSTTDIYKGVVPFVGLQMIGLALCVVYPPIINYLPGLIIQ